MAPSKVSLFLALATLIAPSTQQINYQPDPNDHEVCHDESMNLGTCLGEQQQTTLDFTNEILNNCIQCSGPYRGDETCEELKGLHNSTTATDEAVNVLTGEIESITTGDNLSFCETYNNCVRTNCPPLCWKEHVRWLECVIVELDCDLGCVSVELGHGFVGEEFILGVTNSVQKGLDVAPFWGLFVLLVAWSFEQSICLY